MKKFSAVIAVVLMLSLSGCGTLFPKKVEFFQDKVQQVPEATSREKEILRQAAQKAHDRARDTVAAAYDSDADPRVIVPAEDVEKLTDAVAMSVGPPLKPAAEYVTASELSVQLKSTVAKLTARLDEFKEDNNKNAGKKIEGTGIFQVPYFVWLGIVLVLVFVGFIILAVAWTFLKMFAMSNPPVALGVGAVQAGAGFLKRALAEVTKGGEQFKDAVMKEVTDPDLQIKIKEIFRTEHQKVQSADTQSLLSAMTQK